MNTDSFKSYVQLLHKKEVRKNLLIGGSIFLAVVLIFVISMTSMKSSFEDKLIQMNEMNNQRLDSLIVYREQQVNRLQAGITQDHVRRWKIISVEKLISYTQRNMAKNKRLKQEPRHRYATWIVDESTRHGLDISLVASVIAQESKFRNYSMSEVQAQGLMQVMEETGRWLSKELGIVYTDSLRFNPQVNIKMGTYYLDHLMVKYNGDVRLALGHYNGGSYQSRGVVLKPAYKNDPDYKRGKTEVEIEYTALRERLKDGEVLTTAEKNRFTHLDKVRCALNLTTETEGYVPEVLERAVAFKKIMDDPSSLILGAAIDTTEISDNVGANQ